MKIAICILARNEAATIGPFLADLAGQTLLNDPGVAATVFVAANGCSDDTAAAARKAAEAQLALRGIAFQVFDFIESGKSRSWNRLVHREMRGDFDLVAFLDADITFISNTALANAVQVLNERRELEAYTGYPVKHIAAFARKGMADRLSLATSQLTRYVDKINGSFYVIRSACLARIWLPDDTPGDDGFLNAMVDTAGFTRPAHSGSIAQSAVPTHYFEAHDPMQFFAHERRMIVGTMINRWLFEYLMAHNQGRHAGDLVARLNAENPQWVEDVIARNVSGRNWVIPWSLLTRRLRSYGTRGWLARMKGLPVMLAATMLTVPPAITANRTLRRRGAAAHW